MKLMLWLANCGRSRLVVQGCAGDQPQGYVHRCLPTHSILIYIHPAYAGMLPGRLAAVGITYPLNIDMVKRSLQPLLSCFRQSSCRPFGFESDNFGECSQSISILTFEVP